MSKTLKKLLASALAATMLFSTAVTALVASAATTVDVAITVDAIEVACNATKDPIEVPVKMVITETDDATGTLAPHVMFDIEGATVDAQATTALYASGGKYFDLAWYIEYDADTTESKSVIVESSVSDEIPYKEVTAYIIVNLDENAEAVTVVDGSVQATNVDEYDLGTVTLNNNGNIALTHTAADAVVENEVPADCDTAGSYDSVVKCSACEEEISRETVTVDALGHSYVDGVCSVCGDEDPDYNPDPVVDEGITFKHALNLASDIAITFRIPVEDMTGYDMDTVYAEAYREVYTFGDNAVMSYSETVKLDWALNGNRYDFKYSGLTAREMFVKVYFKVYGVKDGVTYCSNLDSYAIKDWCLSASASSNANTRGMGATLAYYGECAQIYRDYCTDNLASGGEMEQYMSNRHIADMSTYTDGKTEVANESGVNVSTKWARALMLTEVLGLNCIVDLNTEYASKYNDLTIKYTYESVDNGTVSQNVALTPYANTTNRFNYEYYGLKSYEFNVPISFAVYEGDTQVTSTYTTCVNDWCAAAYGALADTNPQKPLAAAIVSYNEMAKTYFGK